MDFRLEFDKVLRQYGHNILLQRSKSPLIIEKHTVRHVMASGAAAGTNQEQIEGLLNDAEMVYYFRWSVNPEEGDLIYVDPVSADINLPFTEEVSDRVQAWKIAFSIPMRGKGGRVEYWATGMDNVSQEIL